jgi:hypothetical protein
MQGFVASSTVSHYSHTVLGHAERLRAAGLLREDLFIGGRWVPAASEDRLEVADPATGTVIATVACAAADDVRAAIAAADQARQSWGEAPAAVRAAAMSRWHELVVEHGSDLAVLLTAEQGKPLAEARGEVAYSAAFVRFYAEEARRSYGEVIPYNQPGRRLLSLHGSAQARERDPAERARAGRAHHRVGGAPAHLHRLHRGRAPAAAPRSAPRCSCCRCASR